MLCKFSSSGELDLFTSPIVDGVSYRILAVGGDAVFATHTTLMHISAYFTYFTLISVWPRHSGSVYIRTSHMMFKS